MASRALKDGTLVWPKLRGRNGFDAPAELPIDMAAEAMNTVLVRGTLGQKRKGSDAQSISGASFSGYNQLARFVPGQNDSAAELHWVSRDGTPKIMRVAGGTTAVELTLTDAIASLPQNADWTVLNGKLYWAYDSSVNRLHVFDPSLSTTVVRRVGLAAPSAPTAGNTGSGSYAATLRYYRVQGLVVSGGNTRLASNLSASVSFTPSGSGTAARVTAPTWLEGETHWIVYGSEDDTVYYKLSGQIAVATTTYDDSEAPADYSDNEAAPTEGANTPWPSVKFLANTGERLLGFGAWETSAGAAMQPRNGRVYFSPVLDTSDVDDDERVNDSLLFQGFIDISRDAGAEDRALAGPMDGQIFALQSRGLCMLVPTTNAEVPYRRVWLSNAIGAVNQWSTFLGEDEAGRPCLYFLDPERGPYRYGAGGLQWLGYDIQDVWSTVNLAATNRVAVGCFDLPNRRCIWSIATGSANDPSEDIIFHVREGQPTQTEGVRYGWTRWSGDICTGRTLIMFSATMGATMSRKLKPYAGLSSKLLRAESDSATSDDSVTYRAYMRSAAFDLQPLVTKKSLGNSWVQAKTAAGVTIQQSLIRNYGDVSDNVTTMSIAANGSETRTLRRFSAADLAEAWTFQVELGDTSAIANSWTLDRWMGTIDVSTDEVSNIAP